MRAMVHPAYGPFEGLALRDVRRPIVKDDDVLIRVHAVGLHVGDGFGVRGSPFVVRLFSGLVKPKVGIPGFDVSGRVEAVGKNVTRFAPGDHVFGANDQGGGCAEYVCRDQNTLAHKPANLSFEEAAALPTSGLAALHGLRDAAKLKAGQSILINGASGGVGHFAVQIAKSFGAKVTGVCSAESAELVRSLGADEVIDYTREDFTTRGSRYDVILDNVENRPLSEVRRAVTPSGTLILNSGTGASGLSMLARLVKPILLSPFVAQDLRRYLSVVNHQDLLVLKELVEARTLKPVVDKVYPLHETACALARIAAGHVRGKVVIAIGD